MPTLKKNEIISLIKTYLPENPIIVEAGAFDGRDTKLLSEQWPAGVIHAFEPVPDIFDLLERNTQNLKNVIRHNVALSDKTGSAPFYVSQKPKKPGLPFQAGSLLKPKERLKFSDVEYKKMIEVPTITLDDWAEKQKLNLIDFLWLDMQGMELNVLKAAPRILSGVKVIYTEVEFMEAYEGQYLYSDVAQWLTLNGFKEAARDFADQTSWFFGNVLFVRSNV